MSVITSIDRTKLGRTYAPRLPTPPREWDDIYQNQLNNALRLYFERLDNIFASILDTAGGKFLSFPYGAFSSYADQPTTANTATLMTLDTTDFASGVSVVAGSKITVENPGIYNLQWSGQFQNVHNQLEDATIWLKQGNGAGAATDITGSTGFISIPNSHGGGGTVPGHGIYGWNYFLSMQAEDYIQLYWSATSADVSIQTYPTQTGPIRPSTASLIATLSFVSALPREV
jgi:hypothetical protein